jgi:NAD+ synthase (glutamine-hydrolysing)
MSPLQRSAFGYFRLAAASPKVALANPAENARRLASLYLDAKVQGAEGILTPELSLTGYTCADLFFEPHLLDAAFHALARLAPLTADGPFLIVGLPVRSAGRLFNAAAFLSGGKLAGITLKSYLPGRREFYEPRWFSPASDLASPAIDLPTPFGPTPAGTDLLFQARNAPDLTIAVEICEDLWAPLPPSTLLATSGATLILNPSASPEMVGKATYRHQLVAQQSARCLAAYALASSGFGESSTDLLYSGHLLIAENGQMLAENRRFAAGPDLVIADLDLQLLQVERSLSSSFSTSPTTSTRTIPITPSCPPTDAALLRPLPRNPFVPADPAIWHERAEEILSIQSSALAIRLDHIGCRSVVIGISGGLDSTLALIVAARAFDALGLPRSGILTTSMPGPGTTSRTRSNADALAAVFSTSHRTIPIADALAQHLADIGHPPDQFDITYENSQARERTQILMDLANRHAAIVVGTGDLSESALGWCTFNGDHMSMYHVNAGVPKTLVRHLVQHAAQQLAEPAARDLLLDVVATPITPELLPTTSDGQLGQLSEQTLGPYEIHDFFLFHAIRHHAPPPKVLALATIAFADTHSPDQLAAWLKIFYRRFFQSQFKRSSLPDGPKIGALALSPRGDWRMPSDAAATAWLDSIP